MMLMMDVLIVDSVDGVDCVDGFGCIDGVNGVDDYDVNVVADVDFIVNIHGINYDISYDIDNCVQYP